MTITNTIRYNCYNIRYQNLNDVNLLEQLYWWIVILINFLFNTAIVWIALVDQAYYTYIFGTTKQMVNHSS